MTNWWEGVTFRNNFEGRSFILLAESGASRRWEEGSVRLRIYSRGT
jgi:hypothetical protein